MPERIVTNHCPLCEDYATRAALAETELEAYKQDAERYRKLRCLNIGVLVNDRWDGCFHELEEIDALCDKLMEQGRPVDDDSYPEAVAAIVSDYHQAVDADRYRKLRKRLEINHTPAERGCPASTHIGFLYRGKFKTLDDIADTLPDTEETL